MYDFNEPGAPNRIAKCFVGKRRPSTSKVESSGRRLATSRKITAGSPVRSCCGDVLAERFQALRDVDLRELLAAALLDQLRPRGPGLRAAEVE